MKYVLAEYDDDHIAKLAQSPQLTPRAARVWMYLDTLEEEENPGVKTIAKRTGMSAQTVNQALQELMKLECIEREN